MSGLASLLDSSIGRQIIGGISNETGTSEGKTSDLLSMALPLLTGAMKKNASTPEGAQGLMGAINSKHDGSILDNLGGFFGGGVDQSALNDGAGILGHVLGGKQSSVENALSSKTGIDAGTVGNILKMAAPLILGYLGRQTKQNNISGSNDMSSLLGSMLGGQSQENQSLITSLIDTDGDGSVLDDVADMVIGSNKKKGGLGGLLGNFLNS
ncbi:DUF937 domain-containing protein [Galbibacter pacificus]|uniref:DUF937 domain-containing protein n=1 Tax=Galbibacter pacificus TaxID=2996052 RepID=A0ABT6FQ69_9FLAO|nr:DUF937 domain-containing protein [Galbibacter pacificus]MDG3582114.1 DUF937 domain-containing protein [Galbibacter pacificus]MDG3585410.1 DUF937 domain-containing protein [Galbibacter pacificus]